MSDERLRELERRWKETGSVKAEAAFLAEHVRVGGLTQLHLELAAWLGHPAARLAINSEWKLLAKPSCLVGYPSLEAHTQVVSAMGPTAVVRAGASLVSLLPEPGENRDIDDVRTAISEALATDPDSLVRAEFPISDDPVVDGARNLYDSLFDVLAGESHLPLATELRTTTGTIGQAEPDVITKQWRMALVPWLLEEVPELPPSKSICEACQLPQEGSQPW